MTGSKFLQGLDVPEPCHCPHQSLTVSWQTSMSRSLDLAQRQRITDIHHHYEADDLGRIVETAKGIFHPPRLEMPFSVSTQFALTVPVRGAQTELTSNVSIFADPDYRTIGGMGHPRTSEKARNNSTSAEDILWSCRTLAAQAFNSCGLAKGFNFSSFSRE